MYGFAGGDPVNFSDPFGLCKNAKGEEVPAGKCRDVTAEEGKKVYDAAVDEGAWTYTQGRKGEPAKDFCANKGDCTDFVEAAMRGAGLPELSPRPATAEYPGTSYRALGSADTPRAGDVIIVGGHAGVLTGSKHADGTLMAIQNGNSGVKSMRFKPGVNGLSGTQTIHRRQVPQ